MFKLRTVSATALSALAFTTVCLLSSAITAQAQVEPQQGAINTSRSNIKNTSRTGDLQGQISGLGVDLLRYGGLQFGANGMTPFKSYKVDKGGNFDLGILPTGKYELRITQAADADDLPDRSKKQLADAVPPPDITVTLDGATGGPIKRDMTVSAAGPGATTARTTLDTKISTAEADLSRKRPGAVHWGNISFETDGKHEVKGGIVIKNIKKPNRKRNNHSQRSNRVC